MKILYGVCGEGMGHYTRSSVIINHLLEKGHQAKVVSSHHPYRCLKEKFPDVERIGGWCLTYKDNSIKRRLTLWNNFKKAGPVFYHNLKLWKIMFKYCPELIITDFEPFTAQVGLLLAKPVLCIDNQHIIKTELEHGPEKIRIDWFFGRLVIKGMIPWSKQYLVTTFFYPKNKHKKICLVPPIIRKEILQLKPEEKDYFLVYQTSTTNLTLIEELKKIKKSFIVYGFEQEKQEDNLLFKKFNETEFLQDLAHCQAVITNGGYSLISEALYLHKPIFSVPIKKTIEQYINSFYLDKLGYGKYVKKPSVKEMEEFIKNLPKYKKNLENYSKTGNEEALQKVDEFIENYSKN